MLFVLHHEKQDLPETGGYRPHFRVTKSFRDFFPGHLQPFANQLPGEVDIRAVLKINIDHREPEIGNGADLLEIRQAIHRRFNGIGDELFHLLGGKTFGFCKHLHQRRGDIRKSVHRQLLVTEPSASQHKNSEHSHQETTAQNKTD